MTEWAKKKTKTSSKQSFSDMAAAMHWGRCQWWRRGGEKEKHSTVPQLGQSLNSGNVKSLPLIRCNRVIKKEGKFLPPDQLGSDKILTGQVSCKTVSLEGKLCKKSRILCHVSKWFLFLSPYQTHQGLCLQYSL